MKLKGKLLRATDKMSALRKSTCKGVPTMVRLKREYYVVVILVFLLSALGFAEEDAFTPVVASLAAPGVQPFP